MSRKYIDMDKYPRLDHFRHFLTMQQPCVSVTVQVDITDWLSGLKASGCPFFLSFQYAVVKAANPSALSMIKSWSMITATRHTSYLFLTTPTATAM